jgi:hypothetical protein
VRKPTEFSNQSTPCASRVPRKSIQAWENRYVKMDPTVEWKNGAQPPYESCRRPKA